MEINVRAVRTIEEVAEAAAITQDIEIKIPSVETWLKWLHSEHSMIRCFELRIEYLGIPYYNHVHFIRHHVGIQPFVRSQRPTAINPVEYDRRKAPQDALVDMILDVNPQTLINMSLVRLCHKADTVTHEIWRKTRRAISKHENPYISRIANVMMSRCLYRGGVCHELKPCGLYPHYSEVK